MPTPVICCGFECGLFTGTGTFGQGHISNGSGSPTFDTTTFRSGLRALRCTSAASTTHVNIDIAAAAVTRIVGRFYFRFATMPGTACAIVQVTGGPSIRISATDQIRPAVGGTVGASSAVLVVNTWYRLDFDFSINVAGNDTATCAVDGLNVGNAADVGLSAGVTALSVGLLNTVTADLYLDDLIISTTAADYPLGSGHVVGYVPNADGTHTATTTTIVRGTLAAPTGGGNVATSTDTNAWVNGRPLLGGASDNTRLVNHQTNGSTLYAEVDFEPSVEANPPDAVEVITADRQAGTGTGDFQVKLNDNGTEDVVVNRGVVAGAISDRYVNKQYATMVGGGAWTSVRFNALKARFGYSSDANPDQYWRGIMLEADFPDGLVYGGRPDGYSGQVQMQSLLAT